MPLGEPMFDFHYDPNADKLDDVITQLLAKMETMVIDSKEYGEAVDNLVNLYKIKNDSVKIETEAINESAKVDLEGEKFRFEKEKIASWRPSPDAVVGAAASILGIIAILQYEKIGVVTSKALGFINKMK
jgi:hypothetical protein